MYWARELADQKQDKKLAAAFSMLADTLEKNEAKIVAELNAAQGKPVDIGGYYKPDRELANKAMRPSATFNKALDNF
jgi:isocitrate dehydrogenase